MTVLQVVPRAQRARRPGQLLGRRGGLAPDGHQNYARERIDELSSWGISAEDITRITVTNPATGAMTGKVGVVTSTAIRSPTN